MPFFKDFILFNLFLDRKIFLLPFIAAKKNLENLNGNLDRTGKCQFGFGNNS